MSTDSGPVGFQKLQIEFAAHIRNPDKMPIPEGIERRRMQVYVDNFFRTVRNFLSNTLKRTSQTVPARQWNAIIRDFMCRHQCHSPFFLDLPKEFLQYLLEERDPKADPPFLPELCHYECIELELKYHPATVASIRPKLDFEHALQLSPLARPLSYEWKVHETGTAPTRPQNPAERVWLILVRDRKHLVRHLLSSTGVHRLMQCFEAPKSAAVVVDLLARELGADAAPSESQIQSAIEHLYASDVLIEAEEHEPD